MDFLDKKLQHYADIHTSPESEILKELNRDTYANMMQPRMLSGHYQGRFLSMLSKMIRPELILEIGTFTGYSAICLAEGLREKGKLITIDVNAELESKARKYFSESGMKNKIQFIIGDALQIIKTLPYKYDLVFIDADKPNYINYYNLVFERVKKGGYILADNVLWSGKVLDKKELASDKDAGTLNEFNDLIQKDERVENILLPLRDGLMLIRKN
ncbi:MAG: O-methyltransferase [Bacteroidia bacterium]